MADNKQTIGPEEPIIPETPTSDVVGSTPIVMARPPSFQARLRAVIVEALCKSPPTLLRFSH